MGYVRNPQTKRYILQISGEYRHGAGEDTRKAELATYLKDETFAKVKARQRTRIQARLARFRKRQTRRITRAWTEAQKHTDTTKLLAGMPPEKTKEHKAFLQADKNRIEAYTRAVARHKEIISMNPLLKVL